MAEVKVDEVKVDEVKVDEIKVEEVKMAQLAPTRSHIGFTVCSELSPARVRIM